MSASEVDQLQEIARRFFKTPSTPGDDGSDMLDGDANGPTPPSTCKRHASVAETNPRKKRGNAPGSSSTSLPPKASNAAICFRPKVFKKQKTLRIFNIVPQQCTHLTYNAIEVLNACADLFEFWLLRYGLYMQCRWPKPKAKINQSSLHRSF